MVRNLKILIMILVLLVPLNSWSLTMDEVKEISYPFGDVDTNMIPQPFQKIILPPVTGTSFFIDPDKAAGAAAPVLCDSGIDTTATLTSSGISAKLMECISGIINSVSLQFMTNISSNISNTLRAVLGIGFVLFVVTIIFGAQRAAAGPTMLFAFKYIFVIFLATNPVILNDYRQDFFNSSVGLGYIMTEELLPLNYRCKTTVFNAAAGQFKIFEFFDCIVLDLIGYRIGIPASCQDVSDGNKLYTPAWPNLNCDVIADLVTPAQPGEFQLFGLSLIVAGLFFTGPVGAAITVLAISLIMSIIVALVQSMLLYITSLFAVTVLFALAPILAPLLLFEQTKSVFKLWWQHIFAYSLQPVILVAFLAIILGVLANISELMGDFYSEADEQNIGATQKNECVLFDFDDIASYDKSGWSAADIADYNNRITIVKSGGGGGLISWISGTWNSFKNIVTSTIDAVTGAVIGGVTKVARAVRDVFLDQMGLDSLKVFCLKWHSGEISLLFANLFAGFLLLLLSVSFIKRIPDLIDKLVAPGIVSNISQFASADANKIGNTAVATIAAKSSLRRSANSTVRR